MSERETLSISMPEASAAAVGRLSRVTLESLVNTYLSDSRSKAVTCAYREEGRAIIGVTLCMAAYDAPGVTCVSLLEQIGMFQNWLTKYATVAGYLLAIGESYQNYRSTRRRVKGILSTSGLRELIDAADFTTKVGRARVLTQWALGDGRYKAATDQLMRFQLLWDAETTLRLGLRLTYVAGS